MIYILGSIMAAKIIGIGFYILKLHINLKNGKQ